MTEYYLRTRHMTPSHHMNVYRGEFAQAHLGHETLKFRIQTDPVSPPDHFNLTSADVAQHRKIAKPPGSRR